MIRDEKKTEVEEEIRRQVDNLMREELDLLKAVSYHKTSENSNKLINSRLLREIRERRVKSARSERRGRKEARRARRRKTRISHQTGQQSHCSKNL